MWNSDLHTPTQVSMGRGASGPDLPTTQRLLIEPLASQAATQLCRPGYLLHSGLLLPQPCLDTDFILESPIPGIASNFL